MFKLFCCFLSVFVVLLCMMFVYVVDLLYWLVDSVKVLNVMIVVYVNCGDYVVFDVDNMIYCYDFEELLLLYFENCGVLMCDVFDLLLKLILFKDFVDYKELLMSYYYWLCEIDDLVCYLWIVQVFVGQLFVDLKCYVDVMFVDGKLILICYWQGDKVVDGMVNLLCFFCGMQELYNVLCENGIEVYVMMVVYEEFVWFVLVDLKYGYNVKLQNVIGVMMLLCNLVIGVLMMLWLQIKVGKYDEVVNCVLVIMLFLMNLMMWYEGKFGLIVGWIDQWKKLVFVVGDMLMFDGYMLLNVIDVVCGGVCVWVNKKDKQMVQICVWLDELVVKQKLFGLLVMVDKNWIVVKFDVI